jgi:hypothetical protein
MKWTWRILSSLTFFSIHGNSSLFLPTPIRLVIIAWGQALLLLSLRPSFAFVALDLLLCFWSLFRRDTVLLVP